MKRLWLIFFLLFYGFELIGQLARGPYLQMVTPNSITIRWRTAFVEDSKIAYGLSPDKLLTIVSPLVPPSTEHEVQLTNLTPNTKYYYSIGSSQRELQRSADNNFVTAPAVGTTQKIRFLALGDCGLATPNQIAVRDQFLKYTQDKPLNLAILLGDNAYIYGKDDEYQAGFFDAYQGNFLKNTPLFPATGNHEYGNNPDFQVSHQIAYFDIFTLPQNAEAGGVASGTEAYYSYDYGNVHFISLDSYIIEGDKRFYDTLSPQIQWLKKDLAATKQPWKIAYWHHPPYTKGSYDSDTVEELYLTRQNLLRILERNGVDLVLCGHSHVYERSVLLKNHYGTSDTFRQKLHSMSRSNGRYDGSDNSCPFTKEERGTVYVVAGTGSIVIPGRKQDSYPHKAMVYSNIDINGSVIVEVEDNRLDAKWLCEDGVIRDQFTLMKKVKKQVQVNANRGESLKLNASWIGDYEWSSGEKTKNISTKNLTASTTLFVTDKQKCLVDSFFVSVPLQAAELNARVYPNPTTDKLNVSYEITDAGLYQLQLLDENGNVLSQLAEGFYEKGTYEKSFQLPENIPNEKTVYLKIQSATTQNTKKIRIIR